MTHRPRRTPTPGLVLGRALLAAAVAAAKPSAMATTFVVNSPDGGDCDAISGTWDPATQTCTVSGGGVQLSWNDLLVVDSVTLRIEVFFINDGTIQNLGFIDVYLTLDSHGTLGIASGARVHVNPGAELYNGTLIDNDGTLINHSFLTNAGNIENTGIIVNSGSISNFLPFPFDPFINNGVVVNLCSGVIGGSPVTGNPPIDAMSLGVEPGQLSWCETPVADVGFDVVRGDLGGLRASGGDFAQATAECLADNEVSTSVTYGVDPPAGEGFWFAVRPVGLGGNGSYDSGFPSQPGSRDGGIAASGNDCP